MALLVSHRPVLPLRLRAMWLLLAGCWLAWAVSPSGAQASPGTPGSPSAIAREPSAMALREKMVRAYRSLRSYRAHVIQRQWKSAPDQASVIEIEFRFQKPNRLYLQVDYPQIAQPGRWHLTWACDGKTLTFYNSARHTFQRIKAPVKLDKLILAGSLRGPEFDLLLRDADPFAALEKTAPVHYTAGFEQQAQEAVNVLQVEAQQEGARRTLRYRLDPESNLLRGFTLRILPDPGTVSPFLEAEEKATVEVEYTQVEANPRLTDADFAFTPPADARETGAAPQAK